MPQNLLDEGTYKGTVTDWNLGILSTGTEFFYLTVRLTQRQDPDSNEMVDLERPVYREWKTWLNSPDNVDRTIGNLNYLGYDAEEKGFSGLDPTSPDAHDFRGQEVFLNISHGVSQKGEIQENVNLSKRRKPPTAEQKATLQSKAGALFEERVRARRQRVQEAFTKF